MSQKEKLLAKIQNKPKDFTVQDADSLLSKCGFKIDNKGKTSGSSIGYINDEKGVKFSIHKPHPGNILKRYQIERVLLALQKAGEIK